MTGSRTSSPVDRCLPPGDIKDKAIDSVERDFQKGSGIDAMFASSTLLRYQSSDEAKTAIGGFRSALTTCPATSAGVIPVEEIPPPKLGDDALEMSIDADFGKGRVYVFRSGRAVILMPTGDNHRADPESEFRALAKAQIDKYSSAVDHTSAS